MVCMDSNLQESRDIEIDLLLEAVFRKYGHDFRDYIRVHIKRRIDHRMRISGCEHISDMQHRVLYDRHFFEVFLQDFSINVTELFRDPSFYLTVRRDIVPVLKTYPHIKIWHAGCATGEEVYSMSILLREEGLSDKARIYATDYHRAVVQRAKRGVYPIENMKEYTLNYQKSGGRHSFADYYRADYGSAVLDRSLRDGIIFADHNLVTDGVFGDMHMVVCRNVLIYFNRDLQHRVIRLFMDSLLPGGFLCLGKKETLRFSGCDHLFEPVSNSEKIYKKRLFDSGDRIRRDL